MSEAKNSQIWRRESQRLSNAIKPLSRLMKKTINGRKSDSYTRRDDEDSPASVSVGTSSSSSTGLRVEKIGGTEYFQVEISSNRLSSGSDKYSVVTDAKQEITDHKSDEDHYTIIDMTDPVPRWSNYSGPDIIQDLPTTPSIATNNRSARKVVRSSSFLSQPPVSSVGGGGGGGGGGGVRRGRPVQRSVSSVSNMTPRPICGVRAVSSIRQQQQLKQQQQQLNQQQQQQQSKPSNSVQRSFSNVSNLSRPSYVRSLQQRRHPPSSPAYHHHHQISPAQVHTRQGSVSSTSSGSLGSSGFVSPNKVRSYISSSSPAHHYHRVVQKHSSSPFSTITRPSPPTATSPPSSVTSSSSSAPHQFQSSNSAFRRPKPVTDKRKELEMYASQYQDWGNRR